jgi:ornithine cyclodeaminase/alanine dehydrogenase-like protein (mu-crystallin family)
MAGRILRLDYDEVWLLLDRINPIELMAAQLIAPTDVVPGSLVPGSGDLVVFQDKQTGSRCQLPALAPHHIQAATLSALAAHELLAPAVGTVAVLGSGRDAHLQLAVITRHLPDISHVAVFSTGGPDPLDPRIVELLDRAGVGLTVVSNVDDAVFGANLVILTGSGRYPLTLGRLARGAVLINAAGEDLPVEVVDAVDEVYVDSLGLLETNQHRHVVKAHLGGSGPRPDRQAAHEGWHRQRAAWQSRYRIDADIGQVLAGQHAGRMHIDHIVLVELLGFTELDVILAHRLQQAALEHDIGAWLTE